jgi:hypothetical protein
MNAQQTTPQPQQVAQMPLGQNAPAPQAANDEVALVALLGYN